MAKIIKKCTNFMIVGPNALENTINNSPKLIIIFGHPKCKPCQQIMFRIPIIYFKSYRKGITLKFCNVLENKTDCKHLGIESVPYSLYCENGKISKKLIDENEVFDFLKKL